MQFMQLSYLEQLSSLLEDKYQSQAARLGYIAKQIREKHVVHVDGADTPKLRRCKSCQASITCKNIRSAKNKNVVLKCDLCGGSRYCSKVRTKQPIDTEE